MKTVICIPTYNEAQNIKKMLPAISSLKLSNTDILIIDDNSPDHTSSIAKKIAKSAKFTNKIFVLDRKKKEGLGKAYIAGFKWTLEKNYDRIISMDADFSHDPKYLPEMIEKAKNYDVVVGSRYAKGGKIEGWEWHRYINSYGANFVTRLALGLKPKDATAGFKCYSRKFISSIDLDNIIAGGYAFQVEMINLAQEGDYKIIEFPITFVDRKVGKSKISGELTRSAKIVFQLASRKKTYQQFIKFAFVGLLNLGVDLGFYLLFSRIFGIYYLTSKVLSFTIAATNSYILNKIWTFRNKDTRYVKQFFQFIAVAGVGMGLNALMMYLLVTIFHISDIISFFFAVLAVTLWNFFANKYWTFRESPQIHPK